MTKYLDIAIKAARSAGQYLLEHRGKISIDQVDEKARNDFVTFVDKNSEKLIVDHLLSHFPSHKILAEEGTKFEQSSNYQWIIDPLDGTKNFIHNVPFFSVSIALKYQDEIVLGVIYDPVHDDVFYAEKGKGAFLNQKVIKVSSRPFSTALIVTGFPHRKKQYLPTYLLAFEEIFLNCSGMRRCGSAALDLCYTAAGIYDGFWELGLSTWDMAAGSLIVKEAGGKVSDFWGNQTQLRTGFIIAGNNNVHKNLVKILKEIFSNFRTDDK